LGHEIMDCQTRIKHSQLVQQELQNMQDRVQPQGNQ
jgi:hypothetical protein